MTKQEMWVSFVGLMLTKVNWKDSYDMKLLLETADKMTEEASNRFLQKDKSKDKS
jgi:hypothetical protein